MEISPIETLSKLKVLAEHGRAVDRSLDSLVRLTALHTLNDFAVRTIFLASVKEDGLVEIIAKFGCTDVAFAEIPPRRVSVEAPVNRALRTGEVLECGSADEYFFAGPGYRHRLFPFGFESSIAFPVPGFGSAVIYCAHRIDLTLEVEEFLRIVGRILSMIIREFAWSANEEKLYVEARPELRNLTPRQRIVLEAIGEGLTNQQIAEEFELSEDLVRKDVTQIMAYQGASDRSQLRSVDKDDIPGEVISPRFNQSSA